MNEPENSQDHPNNPIENNAHPAPSPDDSDRQIPAQPPSARPVQPAPEPSQIDDDAQLEQEIQAALGDVSLTDIYDLDQLNASEAPAPDQLDAPGPGLVRGKVISINRDDIFVDLGGKSQGMLSREELAENEDVQIGSVLDVAIIRYDSRDGLLILSKKTADQQKLIRDLHEGAMIEGRVVGSNKGGLEIDIKGIKAFMPASQIGFEHIDDLNSLIGQRYTCQVIQVERGDKNIVVSHRRILEKEQAEKAEQFWAEIEKGQNRHGIVRRLTDFGAFVDIGGVDGLLHIREMSWARIKHPSEILQVDQEIDVLIVGVDREKRRISLSLRQAGIDPWSGAAQKYHVASRHQAQIKKLTNFGAFAELEPGLEGLIPIGQMTWAGRIRHPSDVIQVGQMVEVEVLNIETDRRRLSLSMKRLQENPWANITEKYLKDRIYPGTVTQVADFGAFVNLEPGIDGLVHISQLSDKRLTKADEAVSKGQQVSVRVLSVDPKNHRIALSMKETGSKEEPKTESASEQPESNSTKDKKKRPRRGGLTSDHGDSSWQL